jgi:hypothetical protein
MDREERARAKALEDRVEAMKRAERKYASQTGAALAQEQAAIEERTTNSMERKYKEDQEREERKVEARRRDMEKSKEFNATLVERKRQEREKERQDNINRRLQMESEVARLNAIEQSKVDQRKHKMVSL